MELVGDAIRVSLQTCGLGPFYAHLAGRCWSQNMNITEKQPQLGNVTAHDFINANRPFKGKPQAFGRNCTAVQPKQLTDASDKPEPRGVDAIFLGWHEHSGYMDGSAYVCFLSAMVDKSKKLSILRSRDVRFPPDLLFPVRKLRDAQQQLQFNQTHDFVTDADFKLAIANLCDPNAKPCANLSELRTPVLEVEVENDEGIIDFSEMFDAGIESAPEAEDDSTDQDPSSDGCAELVVPVAPVPVIPIAPTDPLERQLVTLNDELKRLSSRGGGTNVHGKMTGR